MKKTLVFSLLIFSLLIAYSQALHVFEKSKDKPVLLLHEEIDSITTSFNDSIPQHVFYTKDSLYTYNVTDIDSISFNLPFMKIDFHEFYLPKDYTSFGFTLKHGWDQQFEIVEPSPWCYQTGSGGTADTHGVRFICQENKTDSIRIANILIKSEHSVDTIKVTQSNLSGLKENLFIRTNRTRVSTHTWQKRTHQIEVNEPFSFSDANYSGCDWVKYSISEDKKTLYIEIDENKDSIDRIFEFIPLLCPTINYVRIYPIKQFKAGVATPEMQKEALIDLYNTMGGVNWDNNENWLSDKPLSEWAGLLYIGITDDIHVLNISGVSGEFPTSLTAIMDVAQDINISGAWNFWTQTHGLEGVKIPKELTQHPRWNEHGWDILRLNRNCGKGISMEGINLRMKDEPVMFLDSTTSTAYEILARNKYTLISRYMPTDEMANVFLSYRNKGFRYVYAPLDDYYGTSIQKARETANEYPLNIIYTYDSFDKGNLGEGLNHIGSTYILDSIGNVIDYEGHDWDLPNSYYANRIDSILYNLLGEPEPHDPFVTTYYTSTDYSQDGEVITLQKATVGKGIDLVFMGDAYDDRDMGEGGLYETNMKKSMEYFFGVEPYKSFRDRFNVYAVKVVSPNSHIGDGCTQAINYSDEVCFNYVSKIEGIDLNQVTIVNVVNNTKLSFVSGYANMYESGASVAHIEQGGASSIIVHEAGGHGFAKLLDEYIASGYENNYCPPENLESFKQWIKTEYHDRGWGVNVDATNAPDSVVWSHFLQDSRYTDEVGIYQGAWYWPTDLWRASENSVMNNNFSYFNAPSREAIYKRIMQLSEGDDWVYDYEKFVEWDAINRQQTIETKSVLMPTQSTEKPVVVRRSEKHRMPTIIKGSPLNPQGAVPLPDFMNKTK